MKLGIYLSLEFGVNVTIGGGHDVFEKRYDDRGRAARAVFQLHLYRCEHRFLNHRAMSESNLSVVVNPDLRTTFPRLSLINDRRQITNARLSIDCSCTYTHSSLS